MRKYDYSFLGETVPSNIIGLTGIITDLKRKEEFRKLQYVETFEGLKNKAIIESVKGSNAIEGIVTTDSRIKDIVAGAAPRTHDEIEISGYKDALNFIHNNYQNMDINEDTICMLHKMMEEEANADKAGKYKNIDNYIMEYKENGTRRVRFKPVSAQETKKAMEQMLLAYYAARQDSNIPQIVLIPCVIVDFLCIHPFADGNGRISRLLTVLLLYLNGFDIVKYISFEGQVNKYKESYYDALKESSQLWHENNNDYMPFVINFLQMLYRCYKDLDESFMDISIKKVKKSERIEYILNNTIVPISKQEIVDKLPDVSIKTIELTLSKMIKEDKITKIGTYKDARYVKKW